MPSLTQDGGDIASRFTHLLQPIRDLTKNWDVDVAAQLEEYLAEVERIQISFDGGKTSMNFAEAALVIQGSACVYSKKVEYLYTLVYQTLDLIASKKRLQQASSVDEQGQDQDVSLRKDQQEEFLELDDIKEAKNIDLKEDEHTPTCGEIVPRTPIALIPLGQEDKQDVLLSRTGEVLGSKNDFKMNTCAVHASGALLLDLTHLPLVDNSFRIPMSTPTCPVPNQAGTTVENPVDQNLHAGMASDFNTPLLGDAALGDDCDDDDYPPGGMEAPEHLETENNGTEVEGEGRMALRRREKMVEQQVNRLPMKDPWKPLDPYEPGTTTQKPFKKGKPFRLPPSLKQADQAQKKRKRNTGVKVEPKQLTSIEEFITQAFYSHSTKLPKNPLKAPSFLEFEYLYWIEHRRRQEVQKRQKKLLSQVLAHEEIEELYTVTAENEGVPQDQAEAETGFDAPGGDDSDDEDIQCAAGHDNFDGTVPDHCPLDPIALEEPSDNLVMSTYEDLVRHYVEGYLAEAQQYAQETDLSRRVHEWEEKILPTLQNEEKHGLFDIHKYGEEVLGTFQANPKKHFGEVVSGKEPYEICRYFLATLQLANNYNVEIVTNGSGESAVDTMEIRLLHKTPVHAAIASYRAPSVIT